MEIEIVSNKENALLGRRELELRVKHPSAPTPRRMEVKESLAKMLGVSPDLIMIRKISTQHGRSYSTVWAHVYASRETLLKYEPKYLLEREKPKEKKS